VDKCVCIYVFVKVSVNVRFCVCVYIFVRLFVVFDNVFVDECVCMRVGNIVFVC